MSIRGFDSGDINARTLFKKSGNACCYLFSNQYIVAQIDNIGVAEINTLFQVFEEGNP